MELRSLGIWTVHNAGDDWIHYVASFVTHVYMFLQHTPVLHCRLTETDIERERILEDQTHKSLNFLWYGVCKTSKVWRRCSV